MRKRRYLGKATLMLLMALTMTLITGAHVLSWARNKNQTGDRLTSYASIISKKNNYRTGSLLPTSITESEGTVLVRKKIESVDEGQGQQPHNNSKKSGIWQEPVTGMEFVWIPEGCFKMGSPPDEVGRDPDEGPVHEVCIDGFWMGRTEVTNGHYRKFKTNYDSRYYRGHSLNSDDQPVVFINWYEAKAFANWLKKQNRGRYNFRLPTEAEWEYAARAGTTTSRFWGDDPNESCRYANVADLTAQREWSYFKIHNCDDSYEVTAPVGSYKPNQFGLYDMLGNVFEWCEDVYKADAYVNQPDKHSVYNDNELYRVIRGGCWYSWPNGVRSAGRSDHPPEGRDQGRYRDYFLGFRLVRSP